MSAEKPKLDLLFEAAIALESAAQRAAFLHEKCGDDHELRGQLEQLLLSDGQAGSFLETPPVGLQATMASRVAGSNLVASLQAGLAPAFDENSAVVVGSAGHSVLKALARTVNLPSVALREEAAEGPEPIVRPTSPEMPGKNSDSRYQLQGEIARGGMGAILKARDVDLGRELAIKVLLDEHKDMPQVIQRFVEEAQIGGQLQHPGIAPVYELGTFADQRPFFSMKLVKGETLSKLLAERKDPTEDHGRFLGIFEQVCQTMAYAHSRGVIHRDLKPANVMVGAFGEVQVVDWGLAKVLPTGGVADEKKAHDKQQGQSVIQTLRSKIGSDAPGVVGSFGSQTQMGSIMGTPAYMPPEQALGEIDNLDERADVFGLGAILCEILTGQPPYVGTDGTQVFRLASRGKLNDCFERLDACAADAELIALARHCLELEPADRPRDAGVLAERVSGYLESVEARLRESEVERAAQAARADAEAAQAAAERQRAEAESQRAEAESAKAQAESARASEESKRRHTSLALAVAVLLLVGIGSGGWLYLLRQEADRQTAEADAQRKHAEEMQTLAEQRDEQRKEAVAAQQRETELKEQAIAASKRESGLRKVAQEKELAAKRQYYAADSINACYANRTKELAQVYGYLDRWEDATSDLCDWEYFLLAAEYRNASIEFDSHEYPNASEGFGHRWDFDWSSDGRKIVTSSTLGLIEVFDAALGERLWSQYQDAIGDANSGRTAAVVWSPEGKWIAASTAKGELVILDADTGRKSDRIPSGFPSGIPRLAYSQEGTRLAGFNEQQIRIWETTTWKPRRILSGGGGNFIRVAWGPQNRLAACTNNGVVRIWDADSGEVQDEWQHTGRVNRWTWSADGRLMVFATGADNIAIYEVATRKLVRTLNSGHRGGIGDLALSPDGRMLATLSGGFRSLWDIETGRLLEQSPEYRLTRVAWSPDSRTLAGVGTRERVVIWPARDMPFPRRFPGARLFHWGPGGAYFATTQGKAIQIWDAYLWQEVQSFASDDGDVTALCLSPDERWVASADDKHNLTIRDIQTGEEVRRLTGLNGNLVNLAFSPDQKWLSGIARHDPWRLWVWNTETWEADTATNIRDPLLVWSPDSRFVLFGPRGDERKYGDNPFSVWSTERRKRERFFWNPWGLGTLALTWKPDGTAFASTALGGYGGRTTIRFVRQKGGSAGANIIGAHGSEINQLDWQSNGRRLVSVDRSGLARIWNVELGQYVHELQDVSKASWGPYGVRLAVQTSGGVEIHDASSGAARYGWKQLIPLLNRQSELGRITARDLRTLIQQHVNHQEWDAALAAVKELETLAPDDSHSGHVRAEAFLQYAGLPRHDAPSGLGIRYQWVKRDLSPTGAPSHLEVKLLTEVAPESPAALAGLRVGDLIREIDLVPSVYGYEARLWRTPPGNTIDFDLWRDRQHHRIRVKTGWVDTSAQPRRDVPIELGEKTVDGRHDARQYVARAREIYLELCRREPSHSFFLERLLFTAGFLSADEAHQWLETLEQDPRNGAVAGYLHRRRGEAALWNGQIDQAAQDFTAALRLTPNVNMRKDILASAESSLELLDRIARAFPEDAESYAARGTALLRQNKFEEARADLEKSLELEPTKLVARLLGDLLPTEAEKAAKWTNIEPTVMKSAGGATFTLQEDGSILVSGPNTEGDAYTISVNRELGAVAAIRLEVLPDASLPANGPGRHESGNFQLEAFQLFGPSAENAGQLPIKISRVTASFAHSASDADVAGTIDEKLNKVWHVRDRIGTKQHATFELSSPLVIGAGKPLTIVLKHRDAHGGINLGRFRLSVIDDANAFSREVLGAMQAPDPWVKLAVAYALDGRDDLAERYFCRAIENAGTDAVSNESFEFAERFDGVFAKFLSRLPDNPQVHLFNGRRLVGLGKWAEADAAFRKAAELDAETLPKWIQTGYWKVVGYPYGMNTAQPPETTPDPFQPVGRPDKDGQLADVRWQAENPDSNGRFYFGTERACHYVLTRLWSPAEQEVAVQMGDDDQVRLFVNDELLFESIGNGGSAMPKEHGIIAKLRPGWNTVLFKLQNRSQSCSLIVNLSSDPADLANARLGHQFNAAMHFATAGKQDEALAAFAQALDLAPGLAAKTRIIAAAAPLEGVLEKLAERFEDDAVFHSALGGYYATLGRWRESASNYLKAVKLDPATHRPWGIAASALLMAGDMEGYRQHCRAMLKQFHGTDDTSVADVVCKNSLLLADAVEIAELPTSVVRAKAGEPGLSERFRSWFMACNALISYRAGKPADALEWTGKMPSMAHEPGALGLVVRAMSEEQLGRHEQAVKSLAEAEALIPVELRTLGAADYTGPLPVPAATIYHDWLVAEILRREAVALINSTRDPKSESGQPR